MTVGQQLNQSRQQQALQQQLLAAVSGSGGKNALVPDLSQLKPVNLQDPKNLPPGLPADLVKLMNKTTGLAATNASSKLPNDQQPQRPPSKPQPKVDHETPAQKQAAAKLALRQQLEKTLLQVILSKVLLSNHSSKIIVAFHFYHTFYILYFYLSILDTSSKATST